MTEREFDLGVDEFGQIRFVQVERDIHGLTLQRSLRQSFIIGDYKSGNFMSVFLLAWRDDNVVISTLIVNERKVFNTQFHDLKPENVHQLHGTAIYLKPLVKYVRIPTESGVFFVPHEFFMIEAPEEIPIVRLELLADEAH